MLINKFKNNKVSFKLENKEELEEFKSNCLEHLNESMFMDDLRIETCFGDESLIIVDSNKQLVYSITDYVVYRTDSVNEYLLDFIKIFSTLKTMKTFSILPYITIDGYNNLYNDDEEFEEL